MEKEQTLSKEIQIDKKEQLLSKLNQYANDNKELFKALLFTIQCLILSRTTEVRNSIIEANVKNFIKEFNVPDDIASCLITAIKNGVDPNETTIVKKLKIIFRALSAQRYQNQPKLMGDVKSSRGS